ncbi:SusC/RagA family TonB-linked outer membrane protein [Pedobacter gandavensis]|uniref:SusC/RagA family TonB-linked outer membrane protein n=1 Tax=Pedobacter gandavensis TaxID=2679963 RepID=A0ABR6ESJ4_9SPHI|nr:TonB-dependent receptor [Pedobacter gandavensis]MBB2148238.1 SusC/RagA family TonB-linked outer membrane protein [Pedobacter gandavensis]
MNRKLPILKGAALLIAMQLLNQQAHADLYLSKPPGFSLLKGPQKKVYLNFAAVQGIVKDANGQPLPGVSVSVKSKPGNGTSTDGNGAFKLNTAPGDILVFKMVGYATKEVPVGEKTTINVTLAEENNELGEVVVVGYGTQKKVSVTGSVATIKGKELVKSPVANISNALVGRLPGLRATQRSGEPGYDGSSIDIRGLGNALVIVDGVPSDFSQLDPNEIESFTILKDASAAVYGVRAANGVVLVTTKKGTPGKTNINYSTYQGIQRIATYPELANAALFSELSNEAAVNTWIKNNNPNTALSLPFSKETVEQYKNGTLPSTDWFGATVRKNSPQSYHNVNVDGGTEEVKYFFNIGYLNQGGIWRSEDTNYKRYNFRSNINAKIGKNLTAELNLGGRLEDRSYPGVGAGFLIGGIQRAFPTFPIYANNNKDYFAPPNNAHQNSVFLMDKDNSGYASDKKKVFSGILSLMYDIPFIQGLSAKGLFSYQNQDRDVKNYTKKYNLYKYDEATDKYNVAYVGNDPNNLYQSTAQDDKQVFQFSLNYKKTIGTKHNLSALALFESQENILSNFNASREFLLDNIDELFAGVSKNQNNGGSSAQIARIGYVGKVNYDFAGKYLMEFGFRYDGTYKFAPDQRYGFFPNVSAGWRISEEPFMKQFKAIDNLKIRASWGKVGDDGGDDSSVANYINPFQYLTGFNYPNGKYLFGTDLIPGLSDKGLANPLLTWFNSTTMNLGLDISLWKGLLSAEVDVFYRKRTGLLALRTSSLPNTFGATLPQENLNGDNTRGFEMMISHKKTIGDWQYKVSPNVSFTRTKNGYLERGASTNALQNWKSNGTDRWNNLYRGYVASGQFQSQEEINNAPVQDDKGNQTLLPGDIRYKDVNGDGVIDDSDITIIGRGTTPEIFYGMDISVAYKNFDFSVLFQGATNFNAYFDGELQNPMFNNANTYAMFQDRWHRADIYDPNSAWIPGKYPSTIISGSTNNQKTSTFWLKDATYIRLKNFDLGYTFDKELIERIGIRRARIYISGQNIFTADKIKYIDPEAPTGRGTYYPQQKVWTLGVNIGL